MARDRSQDIQEQSRRQEIIQAAVAAFARNGYHGASMEGISKAVGVRKAALYYYFPSKQELLYAVLDGFTQTMLEHMENIYASRTSPVDKLREAMKFHIERIAGRMGEFTVLLSETKYLKSRRKKQIIARRDRYEAIIRRMIQDGVASGELRPLDAKLAALSLLGAINWMYHWYREGQLPPEELAPVFWDMIFRGLGAETQAPVAG